jgi:hypothetical protein
MRDETIEQFLDVLQNIEYAILRVYEHEADLLDLDVIDALDALVRKYVAEEGTALHPSCASRNARHASLRQPSGYAS